MAFQFEERTACPACHSDSGTTLVDTAFTEPPLDGYLRSYYSCRIDPSAFAASRFELVECGACGLLYQRYAPGTDLLRALYEDPGAEPAEARAYHGFEERRRYAWQVEQLLKYFGRPPHKVHVLDYGMGWGNWLQMAQAYGCRTYGAELSSVQVAHSVPGVEVVDPGGLPIGQFHFINTEQVFEHLNHPRDVAERLVAALRTGGLLRVSVPNGARVRELLADPDWSAPKGSARSLNAIAPLEHLNCFTHDSLVTFATSLGLEEFRYPTRQFIEPWERFRFVASALLHAMRSPKGTMLIFRKR